MLVLSRAIGQKLIINDGTEVKVVDINGGQVKIGIDSPINFVVDRDEIPERITAEMMMRSEENVS